MKAAGYARVSGPTQLDGYGIDRQTDTIMGSDYEIVRVYVEAWTGTESDRPVFIEMLTDLLSNGVRVVVIESLDRLSRDLLVQCTLLAKLASEGITLIAAMTGENVTESMKNDPMRRALVQIQGVFAELDKNMLVRRLAKGKEAARAEGKYVGGQRPYGATETEQGVLARIRQLRRKPNRLSWQKVADRLNSEGLLNRRGGEWSRQALWELMQ
jgi:DNA invertase Pin-like site-specific DNA recombinase